MASEGNLQDGGVGGGENKHPLFPRMGDGDIVTGIVEGVEVGGGA